MTNPDHQSAASKVGYPAQRDQLRARAKAAFDYLVKQPFVDPARVGVVGFGVGGSAGLELARSGADLAGVVVVHGDLTNGNPNEAKQITARILVLLGSDDAQINLAQMSAFEEEMRSGGVDWLTIRYGGAAHDFTNPNAGKDIAKGAPYDGDADRRAESAIRLFLAEVFPPPKVESKAGGSVAGGIVPLKPGNVPVTRSGKNTTPSNNPIGSNPVSKPAGGTTSPTAKPVAKSAGNAPSGVPAKAMTVLSYVDENDEAMDGYEGGRHFGNFEKRLPCLIVVGNESVIASGMSIRSGRA